MMRMLMIRMTALLLGMLLFSSVAFAEDALIAAPEYPQMASYPTLEYSDEAYQAWRASLAAQRRDSGYQVGMTTFLTASTGEILSGAEGENRVYSPLSLYVALAMLSEISGGETQAQLLALLGCERVEDLRQRTADLWNATYRNDGAVTRLLATSLWLNESIPFNAETLRLLAESYYAASYRGRMGSTAFDAALQDWLNQQTNGLLSGPVSDLRLPSDGVLALASAVSFSARWSNTFRPAANVDGVFHSPVGELPCTFMRTNTRDELFWGDSFRAVRCDFEQGGAMWFILPDEGQTPDALLADENCLRFLAGDRSGADSRRVLIHLSVPKFDVSSQMELSEGLRALGVTDVFDAEAADFSPLTSAEMPLFLSQVRHDARVTIDEEGCQAAAYTVMMMCGGALPQEMDEVDFVLDRPFLFVITSEDGLPLLIGVVNQP